MALHRLSSLLLVTFLLLGCRDRGTTSDVKKIIGDDDRVILTSDASDVPPHFKKYLNAIGSLSPGGCTVTHIGNGYAVTAGHCFVNFDIVARRQPCKDFKVTWTKRGSESYIGESACREISMIEQSPSGRDYAVIKLSSAPKEFIPLDIDRKPTDMAKVTMFSQPEGKPMEWSPDCFITTGDLNWQARNPGRFKHNCDSEKGSSGSAIISETDRKIVGIHSGGTSLFNTATYVREFNIDDLVGEIFTATPKVIPEPASPVTGPQPKA